MYFSKSNLVSIAMLSTAFFVGQTTCLADEVRSSSQEVITPNASSSSSVTSSTDKTGSSTAVKNTTAVPGQVQSKTYRAAVGPDGAKISATKTKVQGDGNGGVTATREHESHAVGAAGATHHKSAASNSIGADGSTTATKNEATTTTP